jgi:uncharacterized protein (DUF433 family)
VALSRIGFNKKEDKMKVNWKDHIVSTPDVIRGKPRIKGTRIPASLILGYFAAGNTIEEIIAEFPDIDKVHIEACLDYARELAEFEVAA